MLIPNTLFRVGASAMILTNKLSERRRAKYELEHTVRVHLGADTMAYECVPLLPGLCSVQMAHHTSSSRSLMPGLEQLWMPQLRVHRVPARLPVLHGCQAAPGIQQSTTSGSQQSKHNGSVQRLSACDVGASSRRRTRPT